MRRRVRLTTIGALVGALVMPCGALAASREQASGTITAIDSSSFTIQTAGRKTGMTNALTAAANAVTEQDYPYVYGGGHPEAGVASIGIKGPGYNGRRVGYDCSGSVAAALAGAGLWPAGSGVPNDAGIITQLLGEKLIARGAGTAPDEVTLYDDPGVHIFMNIDGRFFGTSDGGGGGNRKGGAGWLYDGAPDASNPIFRRYHVLAAVLKNRTTYGHSLTFQIHSNVSVIDGFRLGDDIHVSYAEAASGSMVARAITYVGARTTNGTITSVAADDSSFTVETAHGRSVKFSAEKVAGLIESLQVGDKVQVISTKTKSGTAIARTVTVTATPVVYQTAGTVVAMAADLSSFTLQTSGGQDLTFSTGGRTSVIQSVHVGDDVQVSYTQAPDGTLTAQRVTDSGSGATGRAGSHGTGGPPGGTRSK